MITGPVATTAVLPQIAVLAAISIPSRGGNPNARLIPVTSRAFYRIDDETVVQVCEVVCGGLIDRLADNLDGLEDARHWQGADI